MGCHRSTRIHATDFMCGCGAPIRVVCVAPLVGNGFVFYCLQDPEDIDKLLPYEGD